MVEDVRRLVLDVRQIRSLVPFAEIHAPILARDEEQRLMRRDALVKKDDLAQHHVVITGFTDAVGAASDGGQRAFQTRPRGTVDEAKFGWRGVLPAAREVGREGLLILTQDVD